MSKIRPATLKHSIVIQRYFITKDSYGSNIKTWSDIKTTRASINPINGNEWYMNSNILNDIDQEIVLRKTDLIPADRMIFKNRIFDIKKVLNFNEERKFCIVLAKERLNEKYALDYDTRITEDDFERITESDETRITEG